MGQSRRRPMCPEFGGHAEGHNLVLEAGCPLSEGDPRIPRDPERAAHLFHEISGGPRGSPLPPISSHLARGRRRLSMASCVMSHLQANGRHSSIVILSGWLLRSAPNHPTTRIGASLLTRDHKCGLQWFLVVCSWASRPHWSRLRATGVARWTLRRSCVLWCSRREVRRTRPPGFPSCISPTTAPARRHRWSVTAGYPIWWDRRSLHTWRSAASGQPIDASRRRTTG
mmetsp:Transcript_123532/g.283269  ORF Transcript_123532/g.283269 Transcript_123532/m.283269 type:complete len:227 (+) Transcript_123532:304-984(+)